MNKQIREYLFNYSKDLEYWIGNEEVDSINHVTNGTPTFETIEEAETYLRGLEKTIERLTDMHEITVREIARLALTKMFDEIGDELDLSDDELFKIRDFLETNLND